MAEIRVQEKKSNAWIWIVLIVLLAIGAYFAYQYYNDQNTNDSMMPQGYINNNIYVNYV